ncbi:xanthine dehydrogenase molybdopterin binding subunit [uncultured Paracoccus sp.]|uniref:xanthine dehydrogenase molybdopterin binding subunit n=1 Tax=uncultured Paracoccus sp. TaxID=189685 RepID=UPI00260BC745|nr:xanthine dehydrogenase molybdopterin binding subunit [uncultured Paracoccus sp.]
MKQDRITPDLAPDRAVDPAPATIGGGSHAPTPHDSARLHVTGQADYTDDLVEPIGTLHAALGLSTVAHGRITRLDLAPVRTMPGVIDVLTADDIPGRNDVSPTGRDDDPILARDIVEFWGQPIFAVIAETRDQARRAAAAAEVEYEEIPHHLDPVVARDAGMGYVTEPLTLRRGDVAAGLAAAPRRLAGRFVIGGQDHFYLEGQIALAVPGEDDEVTIHVSTQHPTEVQHMVAHALDVPAHAVVVNVRRMGGGFGGKETQMSLFACVAAVAAKKWRRAVKLRPDRDEDMTATGKRHDFVVDYEAGFDDSGRIRAVSGDWYARCGFSADLSGPVTDRALFHADNAYHYPDVELRSHPMKTNSVSNTAFRGFGGPQGVIVAERIIEDIAYATGQDTLAVRRRNLYQNGQLTPYHQTVEDQILPRILDQLETSCDYAARRQAVLDWNAQGGIIRRGIALTPVKFGISFTATHYNQAGALVHVYTDGSIMLTHGGTEMGQGLHTKVAQVVAEAFQVDLARIKITRTSTEKVPNTSATAASSGTDLNGMAALDACTQIKDRLVAFLCEARDATPDEISFVPDHVVVRGEALPFSEVIEAAYLARVQLWAAGFYATPKIHWNRKTGQGRPFYYFAYGAACSEVSVDTLTGEYVIERSDVLHDVGRSLNPAIDKGQVEGAFVQGVGWLTSEELWWDDAGRLRTHAPSTYKIPLASDRPKVFNVELADWSVNAERTIKRSKAVGEPPFMLGISVFEAIGHAVASVADYREAPRLDAPATPERVLLAVERLRAGQRDRAGA